MANAADVSQSSAPAEESTDIVFHGTPRNMVVGITFLLAGLIAFTMGMTTVFFAEALAWTFVIWGILFLLYDLYDWNRTWVVSDKGLWIGSGATRRRSGNVWEWANVNRIDLIVKRYEPKPQDVVMQVYYSPPGDSRLVREDRAYSPDLARLIIEHADLKATHAINPSDLDQLPPDKVTYIWNKSGKFAAATK